LRDAVRDLIEGEIRDAIREDGGDIAFEGMDGHTVRVRMGALCSLCPSGPRTVEHYVQKTLRERVDPGLEVAARFVKPYFAR
jgi:Fe-S cluster biogenesis protein NfuA